MGEGEGRPFTIEVLALIGVNSHEFPKTIKVSPISSSNSELRKPDGFYGFSLSASAQPHRHRSSHDSAERHRPSNGICFSFVRTELKHSIIIVTLFSSYFFFGDPLFILIQLLFVWILFVVGYYLLFIQPLVYTVFMQPLDPYIIYITLKTTVVFFSFLHWLVVCFSNSQPVGQNGWLLCRAARRKSRAAADRSWPRVLHRASPKHPKNRCKWEIFRYSEYVLLVHRSDSVRSGHVGLN